MHRPDNAPNVFFAHRWKQRQCDNRCPNALGVREHAGFKAARAVQFKQMHRRKMNAAADSARMQFGHKISAAHPQPLQRQNNLEHMPVRLLEISRRQLDAYFYRRAAFQTLEAVEIMAHKPLPPRGKTRQMRQLPQSDARRHIAQIEFTAQHIHVHAVKTMTGDALQAVFLREQRLGLIVEHERAAFDWGQVFVRVEAERYKVSERANPLPPPARAQRLRSIFNHTQMVRARNRIQTIHIHRQPCQVDRHQCFSARLTPRTKALRPVHLAGLPVEMDRVYAVAGARWRRQRIGAFGDLVSFSFHTNKNLTSIEGGALVLNDEAEALLAQKYRLQGVTRHGFDGMDVDVLGGKFNLSDVAARVGLGQLPHLARFTARRQRLVRHYFDCFERLEGGAAIKIGVELPPRDFEETNWHMFQIIVPLQRLRMRRADFMAKLHARGIGSGVHFPPVHLFKLYRARGFEPGMFPHAERIGASIVTLPLFPAMSEEDVGRVVGAVHQILQRDSKDSQAILV